VDAAGLPLPLPLPLPLALPLALASARGRMPSRPSAFDRSVRALCSTYLYALLCAQIRTTFETAARPRLVGCASVASHAAVTAHR
jgi:hypothetical protein